MRLPRSVCHAGTKSTLDKVYISRFTRQFYLLLLNTLIMAARYPNYGTFPQATTADGSDTEDELDFSQGEDLHLPPLAPVPSWEETACPDRDADLVYPQSTYAFYNNSTVPARPLNLLVPTNTPNTMSPLTLDSLQLSDDEAPPPYSTLLYSVNLPDPEGPEMWDSTSYNCRQFAESPTRGFENTPRGFLPPYQDGLPSSDFSGSNESISMLADDYEGWREVADEAIPIPYTNKIMMLKVLYKDNEYKLVHNFVDALFE